MAPLCCNVAQSLNFGRQNTVVARGRRLEHNKPANGPHALFSNDSTGRPPGGCP